MKDEPAFPIEKLATQFRDPLKCKAYAGLTKREYFAAMAMQGIIISCLDIRTAFDLNEEAAAQQSIKLADALTKELEKDD